SAYYFNIFLQKQSKTLVLKDFFLYIFFIKKCKFIGSSNKSNDKIDKKIKSFIITIYFSF
ncbi:TPA: hypothetical protein ACGO4Y_001938, partial [Streptococcus suis]